MPTHYCPRLGSVKSLSTSKCPGPTCAEGLFLSTRVVLPSPSVDVGSPTCQAA
jgi:hypothetical protein